MTPRQLRWLLAGHHRGMVLLVAAIPGGTWLVGSFSDTVDVELSGHGVVWIQFQAGLDCCSGAVAGNDDDQHSGGVEDFFRPFTVGLSRISPGEQPPAGD